MPKTIQQIEAIRIIQFIATQYDVDPQYVFIAGGWVVNPFRAGDIDVWICTTYVDLADYGPLGCPVGTHDWFGNKVQVIRTPYDLRELLDAFDVTVHKQGFDHIGDRYFGREATPTYLPCRIQHHHDKTEERYARLQDRYFIDREAEGGTEYDA